MPHFHTAANDAATARPPRPAATNHITCTAYLLRLLAQLRVPQNLARASRLLGGGGLLVCAYILGLVPAVLHGLPAS
jgi:hypothetical protein